MISGVIADLVHDYAVLFIVGGVLGVIWVLWFILFTIEVYVRLGDIRALLEQLVDEN